MIHHLSLPTPFPVGPVNVYLLTGDPLTLVDTGPRYDDARLALESGLAALGYRVEDLQCVILTHHHADHVGLAAHLAQRSGAAIYTHTWNVALLADYVRERSQHNGFYEQIWREAGVPEAHIVALRTVGGDVAQWSDPVPNARPLNEGDAITLGGIAWTVFHTPGHAGDLICLWNPASGELLANDHLIRDISSNPVLEPPRAPGEPRPKRLVEYIYHMQRMAALNPTIAWPGHGEPVDDVAGLVRQRLAFHTRRAQRIHEALKPQPLTLWELTTPMFPRLKRPIDYFLALSEVLGHLDLLAEQNRVIPDRVGDVVKWRAV
jgi:glyoxylase-like metal-dependent hydrolase (beta-lactamase superfamily II)